MNNRLTQLLLTAIAVLLALNLYAPTSQTVSAQTVQNGAWKVMAVIPNQPGAAQLEAELNKGWNFHSMVAPENSHVIAVLQKAVR